VLDYYTTPSWILRDGVPTQVEPLSELEWLDFPTPIGRLEAFHTGGGISTLPFAYQGRVDVMEYKTLRYPGHADVVRPIRELGLLDETPVEVKGHPVSPRALFMAVVQPKLTKPEGQDLVALRVEVTGRREGLPARVAWQLIDRYDAARGISAMMRTTGYSLAITGLMQADGRIAARGVHTPDEVVPFQAYVDELHARGICITEVA
jgi:lysine 6-dehydrogenase